MLLGITHWFTLFSRKYSSLFPWFPSGVSVSYGSSSPYTAAKIPINAKKPWKRRNFWSVPSTFLPTLGSSCLRSPYYLLFPHCDWSSWGHLAKPWLSENRGLGLSCAVPVPQYFTRLSLLVLKSFAQEIKHLFFLPLSGKFFLSLLSANFQTQFVCSYSPALLVCALGE